MPMGTGWRGAPGTRRVQVTSSRHECTDRGVDGPSVQFRCKTEQLAQFGEHLLRLFADVSVGVAAELVAASPRRPPALVVLLPGVARVVEAVAVELDGE